MNYKDPLIKRAQRILDESRAIRGTMTMVTPRLMGLAVEEMPAAEAKLEQAEKSLRAVRKSMESMRGKLAGAVGHLGETALQTITQENELYDLAQLVQLMTVAFQSDPDAIVVFLDALGAEAFDAALRSMDSSRVEELATIIEAVRVAS